MAKPVFPGFFFFFSPPSSFKQRLIYFSRKALHFPSLGRSLARAVPWAPLLLPLLSLTCAALPSWAMAKSCSSPSPAPLYAPAIPSCLFFGPGSPLPYPASSSAPKPGCTPGFSQQLPERAVSCKSHPRTFPGLAKDSSPCASPASSSSRQMKGTGKPTSSIPWHGDCGFPSRSLRHPA